jgi:PhnB protein
MEKKIKPVPDGYRTVTPYLYVRGVAKALDFYRKAFAAVETVRMPGPGDSIMHAEIRIGDSIIMMGEENPERGAKSPQMFGGSTGAVFLYVDDVDAWFKRAVGAGAKTKMPPTDMFWGDRYGTLVDPFGHDWGLATHKEDVTPQQVAERQKAAMSK